MNQLHLRRKLWLMATGLWALGMLSACSNNVELQTKIPENDANEIVAVLSNQGISATKITGKEGANVLVADSQIGKAMEILNANGLPRKQNMGLGDVFKKEGMISTPLEERARYIFGLSQELERTLAQMDYVVSARVHVVLPERIAPGEPIMPSSAAVFIKHRKQFEPDVMLPSIRKLVSTSIPGLSNIDKDKISVVFSPTQIVKDGIEWTHFGPIQVQVDSVNTLQWGFFSLLLLSVLGIISTVLSILYPTKVRQLLRLESKNSNNNPYESLDD